MLTVLHDRGKTLCLIGDTASARRTRALLMANRKVEITRLEDLSHRAPTWFAQRQFLVVTSDIKFRLTVMSTLQSHDLDWFSVIGTNNILHPDTKIGRGVSVGNFNDLSSEDICIEDHTHISCYCQFAEHVTIGAYSFVSGYSYINNYVLGQGCVIGLRSTLCNQGKTITIPEYCNFLANSVVTKPVIESATYHGNRKIDSRDSRTHRIT